MPEKIEAKEVVSIVCEHDAPILGIGKFGDHSDKLCFLAQDPAGKRVAIFFTCGHERAAWICAALMEHAHLRQVSITKKGELRWQVAPPR